MWECVSYRIASRRDVGRLKKKLFVCAPVTESSGGQCVWIAWWCEICGTSLSYWKDDGEIAIGLICFPLLSFCFICHISIQINCDDPGFGNGETTESPLSSPRFNSPVQELK